MAKLLFSWHHLLCHSLVRSIFMAAIKNFNNLPLGPGHRKIQITADGSPTISLSHPHVTYHSMHGALQESMHVFINAGLLSLLHQQEPIKVFEMGFGSGLNAWLSLQQALLHQKKIFYYAIELFPLSNEEAETYISASAFLNDEQKEFFLKLHNASWEKDEQLHALFTLHKTKIQLQQFSSPSLFHVIYFDAFEPNAQPELWTVEIFEKMFSLLEPGGLLVTYCSKGDVRRAMQAAGFSTEKLPGPKGKREILRAWKK